MARVLLFNMFWHNFCLWSITSSNVELKLQNIAGLIQLVNFASALNGLTDVKPTGRSENEGMLTQCKVLMN